MPPEDTPQEEPWVLIARAEKEDSFYPEEERITPEMLSAMAAAFDRTFRRVYVVCGWEKAAGQAGGGHWQGEWNQPVGEVMALRVANMGDELWARFEQFLNADKEPAITALSRSGFRERSIRWWPHTPELPGRPPYLRHVAILGAEPPGIHSMPCLDEYYGRATPELQEWVRGSSLVMPTMERTLREPTVKKRTAPVPIPQEEAEMTPEEITELVRTASEAAATRAQAGIEAAVAAALASALPTHIKPVTDGLAEVRTLATEAKTVAEATNTAVAKVEAAATSASIDRRLDALKTSGRMAPAEVEDYGEMIRVVPADKAEEILVKLEARAPQVRRLRSAVTPSPEVASLGDLSRYLPPDGGSVDPVQASIMVRAKEEAAKAGAEGSEPYRMAFAAAAHRISAEMEN